MPPVKGKTPTSPAKPKGRSAAAKKPAQIELTPVPTGPIIYDSPHTQLCIGDDAIDTSMAQDLLGWVEVEKKDDRVLLKDQTGKWIRCDRNLANRPYYQSNADALVQEILNRQHNFNGEGVIISDRGNIGNGQHTLVAVVLAEQIRAADPDGRGKHWGNTPVSIEKLVVFGVDEKMFNTLDTCRPRSFMDVLYRSPIYAAMKPSVRKLASRMTDHAIKLLWSRTGANRDAFAPTRTHSEASDFLRRHSRVAEAVKHVLEEDEEGGIRKFVPPGYASALLYLMGATMSDGPAYRRARTEDSLDLSKWDDASTFWTLLAKGSPDTRAIGEVVRSLPAHNGDRPPTAAEKIVVVCKAWTQFYLTGTVVAEGLLPRYQTIDEGFIVLAETPMVPGIDLGDRKGDLDDEDEDEEGEDPSNDPTPEELEDRKAEIIAEGVVEEMPDGSAPPASPPPGKRAKKTPKKSADEELEAQKLARLGIKPPEDKKKPASTLTAKPVKGK